MRITGPVDASTVSALRQWLLYAHAPVHDFPAVKIRIPDYMTVTVPISAAGCFFSCEKRKIG
jgi:hypothetical protein